MENKVILELNHEEINKNELIQNLVSTVKNLKLK